MNERGALIGALAFSAFASSGLFLWSRRLQTFAPKIQGVKIVPATDRLPAYVVIDLEPSPALLRYAKEGETWEYRVVDARGRTYAILRNSDEHTRRIFVPYAYARPAAGARIEVWADGARRDSTPIESMPLPALVPLAPDIRGPIRAFHLIESESERLERQQPDLGGGIQFVLNQPLGPKEFWTIEVVRTPAQSVVHGGGALIAGALSYGVARLFAAEDVTQVQIRVTRFVHRSRSETVVVRGLRLVKRGKQTTLVGNSAAIPNTLGLDLRFRKNGRNLDPKTPDARTPTLDLNRPLAFSTGEFDPFGAASGMRGFTLPPALSERQSMDFGSTDFGKLNVRTLWIGGAYWTAKSPISGPVFDKPFDVVLHLHKERNETLATYAATIPVEPAPK